MRSDRPDEASPRTPAQGVPARRDRVRRVWVRRHRVRRDRARRDWARGAAAVLVRPRLWPTAVVQAVRLAPPGWWRRPPFVPVPDAEYLRFRLVTQYGSHPDGRGLDREPGGFDPQDLVAYLAWCRSLRRSTVRGIDGS